MSEVARTRAEQTLFDLREATRDAHAAIKDSRQAVTELRQAISDAQELFKAIGVALEKGADARVEAAMETVLQRQVQMAAPAFHDAMDRFADKTGARIIDRVAEELRNDIMDEAVLQVVKELNRRFEVVSVEEVDARRASRRATPPPPPVEEEMPTVSALELVKASGWPFQEVGPHTYRVMARGSAPVKLVLGGDPRAERNAIAELKRRGIEAAIEARQRVKQRERQQTLQNGREAAEAKAQEMLANAPRPPAQEPEIVWLSLDETAEALDLTTRAVGKLIRDGKLTADKEPKPSRYGFKYRIAWPDVMRYAQDHG